MDKRERYQNRIALLQGTLDMLILQTLRWGPQHGYGICQAIRSGSGDVLQVETGSLYPIYVYANTPKKKKKKMRNIANWDVDALLADPGHRSWFCRRPACRAGRPRRTCCRSASRTASMAWAPDAHAVGTHIGNESLGATADVHAFVQLLRDLHRALAAPAELLGGVLLQRAAW